MKKLLFLLIILIWLTTACGGNSPSPTTPTLESKATIPVLNFSSEAIEFTTEDSVMLGGTLFRSKEQGDTAFLLAHMAGDSDQEDWHPFAKELADIGISALAFDFRCYGLSECSGGSGPLSSIDLSAAINYLKEQGFKNIICMGASMGGRGCVSVAFDQELAGLIIISGTAAAEPDRQNLNDFISPEMPKLFIVSGSDHIAGRTEAMTKLFESASEPKTFELLSGSAHGIELFDSKNEEIIRNIIYNFLEKNGFTSQ